MKRSRWHGNGNILLPFAQSVSQSRQAPDAGRCSPKPAAGTRKMYTSPLSSRVVSNTSWNSLALTCRDVCKPLPLLLFFWGLRVTYYHGSQQTSSKIGAFSDTNHKPLVLGALEGLHRTSCCS